METEELQMFLANHNAILGSVKASAEKVPGYEDLLCDIINVCTNMYDNHTYLMPAEKHGVVEVSLRGEQG